MKLSANPIKIVIAARILIVRRSSESSDANRGASIFKTMAQSPHRSVETLRGYVRDAEIFTVASDLRGAPPRVR